MDHKEPNLLRLVQTFIISRITYAAPYLKLRKAEIEKNNRIIRKVTKAAVGIPISAATDRLLEMGIHNTLNELIEAQRMAQYNRLAATITGRTILESLRIPYAHQHGHKTTLHRETREHISVAPITRSMHPSYHQLRRQARAMAVHKQYHSNPEVCYVDTASYPG